MLKQSIFIQLFSVIVAFYFGQCTANGSGTVTTGSTNVFINGKAMAYNGSTIAVEGCSQQKIKQGSINVSC